MRRVALVSGLLLFVGGAIAYGLLSDRRQPGAFVELATASVLLPNGKQWTYRFESPADSNSGCGYGLELRRSSTKRDPGGSTTVRNEAQWISRESAEAVLATSLVGTAEQRIHGVFAVQILDLRDFATDETHKNPFRVYGGIQIPGASSTILRSPDFFLGDTLDGTSVKPACEWREGELCALQFQTADESQVYFYDVVLVRKALQR